MFKRIWKAIKNFFQAEPPIVHKPGSQPDQAAPREKADLALYSGHTKEAPGAYNFKGESEFSFYCRIFMRVAAKLAKLGYSVLVFKHEHKGYSRRVWAAVRNLVKHEVEKCVFGHFNAYSDPRVQGFEALLAKTATLKDNVMGEKFAEMMNKAFGIDLRGYKGTKTIPESHAGGKMVYETSRAGIACILIESLFATHKTPFTEFFFSKEGEDKFVDVLTEFCIWAIEQR